MPEYIVIIICLFLLTATGSSKAPCAAAGLSVPRTWYLLTSAAAMSAFNARISVEIAINAGAAVLAVLPGLIMERGKNNGGAAGTVVLFSAVTALLERTGMLYGWENGVLCGIISGLSSVLLCNEPFFAVGSAVTIPIITKIIDSCITLFLVGYTSLEIGEQTLAAQLIALSMSVTIIWIHSLEAGQRAKAE